MKHSLKTLLLTLPLLALLAASASAQCGGKTVYIQLPDGWGDNIYIMWMGNFQLIANTTKEGNFTAFNLPTGLSNDNASTKEILFINQSQYVDMSGNLQVITASMYSKGTQLNTAMSDKFACSQFEPDGTYIYEDLDNPGKTVVSQAPPNARYFYFYPPSAPEWIKATPFLFSNTKVVKMEMETSKCGMYKIVYSGTSAETEPPNEDIYIWRSATMSLRERESSFGPFNLKEQFDDRFGAGNGGSLYYAPGNAQPWSASFSQPEQPERCQSKLTATIYHKGKTGNSFYMYEGGYSSYQGICRGYANEILGADGKMQWNQWNSNSMACTKSNLARWQNKDDFDNAFKSTPEQNVEFYYKMPFQKRPSDNWEFDAYYMCPDGTVTDYKSTATSGCVGNGGPGSMGGFYLPNSMISAAGGTLIGYTGDRVSIPDSLKWCYDRGWLGAGKGNLDGLTTAAQINAEMQRVCTRRFNEGEMQTGGDPIEFRWEPTGKAGVTGLFCLEMPASFTYEPGQEFFVNGDDDIWVFINNRLAIDLGGSHLPAPGYVKLDTITYPQYPQRLEQGSSYPIDIFYCNRYAPMSNLRISTNINMASRYFSGLSVQGGAGEYAICMDDSKMNEVCGSDLLNHPNFNYNLEFYIIDREAVRYGDTLFLSPSRNPNCAGSANDFTCYGAISVKNGNYSRGDYIISGFPEGTYVAAYARILENRNEKSLIEEFSNHGPLPPPPSSSSSGSGEPSSSSSGGSVTPIAVYAPPAPNAQEPKYYNLKGEPLGSKKPSRAGVYIMRQNGASKMTVVK